MPVWFVMRNARAISEVVILFFRFSRASKSCRIFLVMDKVLKDFFEYDVTWGERRLLICPSSKRLERKKDDTKSFWSIENHEEALFMTRLKTET